MTKANRQKLSEHFKKLGVDNPYKGEKKAAVKRPAPIPPVAPVAPVPPVVTPIVASEAPAGTAEEDNQDA